MKLWFIIYLYGQLAGSIGPLPYDMEECQGRLAEIRVDLANRPDQVIDRTKLKPNDIKFDCLESKTRPECNGDYKDKCSVKE
jgi:hypothetical protein